MCSRRALSLIPDLKPGYRGLIIALIATATACWAASPALESAPDSAPGPLKTAGYSSPQSLRSLIDQDGHAFAFARLAHKTVLVNFIFTTCAVSCPAQTHALVGIQRALPPALRSRVRFVSVTVDPVQDSALALKRYATSMGADLSGWSFVTGKASELDWLQHYYSVGVTVRNDGQFDHEVGIYLLDAQGRLMQRYAGNFDKRRLLREIAEVDALNK
jgi:cytochrome oxidase Cu insertion factor (SCO1/SenC/PrrC family)